MNDRRVTVKHIAETMGRVGSYCFDKNLAYELTVGQMGTPNADTRSKAEMAWISRALLARFESDPAYFLKRNVTKDETFWPWVKTQSRQRKHAGSAPAKKLKRVPSVDKHMASVFTACEGVLVIDFLQKCQTINGEYYASNLRQLNKNAEEMWKIIN